MARPTTKTDLLEASKEQFEKMWALIGTMTEKEQNTIFLFEDRDKNLRDILIHLYEWHQLLLNWVSSNQKGIQSAFLPQPYNWKTYTTMNEKFWEEHQTTSYEDAQKTLKQSHNDVMKIIKSFSNDELFTKKYFSWTGTTSVGSYCVSATSSHYDWAMKKIEKHIKSYRLENK